MDEAEKRARQRLERSSDADFMQLVLYVRRGHGGSDAARAALAATPALARETHVQEVSALEEPLPRWLRGPIPTLVDRTARLAHVGAAAVAAVLEETRPPPESPVKAARGGVRKSRAAMAAVW